MTMTGGPLSMPLPTPTDISRIVLHSPSHIIGTPFATTSTRFEYPFPDCSSGSISPPPTTSSPASSPGSTTTCTTSTTCGSHCSFGSVSFSFNLPLSLPPSAQFHRSITSVSPATPSCTTPGGPGHNFNHNHNLPSPMHPKLRAQNPPPIPPTLMKKRNRWNISYLGRKNASSSIDDSVAAGASLSDRQSDQDASTR